MTTWDDSAIRILYLGGSGNMASGCRLCIGRLLDCEVDNSWPIIEGQDAKRLVDAGEKKARRTAQPIVLKLKTGDRGRPGTRIMLPPKLPRATAQSGLKALPKEAVSGARPKKFARRTTPPSSSVDQVPMVLSQLGDMRLQLARLTQTVGQLQSRMQSIQRNQADRPDIECEVRALRTMVETMRRTWRENQGYVPEHPALPALERNPIGAQA